MEIEYFFHEQPVVTQAGNFMLAAQFISLLQPVIKSASA
jgi:hypothetical protein